MTGSQQEEVIERIAEEESWRKRRRRKHGQRKRGLGSKREKNCRMNKHAHVLQYHQENTEEKRERQSERQNLKAGRMGIGGEGVCCVRCSHSSRGQTAAVYVFYCRPRIGSR